MPAAPVFIGLELRQASPQGWEDDVATLAAVMGLTYKQSGDLLPVKLTMRTDATSTIDLGGGSIINGTVTSPSADFTGQVKAASFEAHSAGALAIGPVIATSVVLGGALIPTSIPGALGITGATTGTTADFSGAVLAASYDIHAAGALNIGTSVATSITIGGNITTTFGGPVAMGSHAISGVTTLGCTGLVTATGMSAPAAATMVYTAGVVSGPTAVAHKFDNSNDLVDSGAKWAQWCTGGAEIACLLTIGSDCPIWRAGWSGVKSIAMGAGTGASVIEWDTSTTLKFFAAANASVGLLAGTEKFRIDGAPSNGNVGLMLTQNNGATALVQVSMGAADSGGAGFKLLRVPN